jgi:hypothetical protein
MLNMHSIQVAVLLEDGVPGTTVWVNVLLPVGGINAMKLFRIGYNLHVALQDNHIITISCMDNNPGLLSKVFRFLQIASTYKVDAGAVPDKPYRNGMWTTIWTCGTDPDGALCPEW